MDIQTGQGRVKLGSIDVMIVCQPDETLVFPSDHHQITNMECLNRSCLFMSRM